MLNIADINMPITETEAKLLHDRGWCSGYGWESEFDWWKVSPYEEGKVAVDSGEVKTQLLTDLQDVRRELLISYYTETLNHFTECMATKLANNHHKGGWDGLDPMQAFKRIVDEASELIEAVLNGENPWEVCKEAADVANFAFIMSSAYGEKWQDNQDEVRLAMEKEPQPSAIETTIHNEDDIPF